MTRSPEVYNQLAAYWGVVPLMAPDADSEAMLISATLNLIRERGLARSGQMVILTMAIPFRSGRSTNTMQVHMVP